MKAFSFRGLIVAFLATLPFLCPAQPFVYDTPKELFSSGDFDGDGRKDFVIVDKETGKFRLGYQGANGLFSWVDCRFSGIKGVSGASIGKFLVPERDSLALTAPDANQLSLSDASSSTAPSRPVLIAFDAGLGPNTIVGVDIGGEGNTPAPDFYVGSIYNSPDPNLVTFLRNDGQAFGKIGEATLAGPASHGNTVKVKAGQPDLAATVIGDPKGDVFRLENLSTGKAVTVASVEGLPGGSEYVAGSWRGQPLTDFIFYKPGGNAITFRPLEEAGGGIKFAKGVEFDLGQPVQRVVNLPGQPARLAVIFGEGKAAGIYSFDGLKAPELVQTISATNDFFTCFAPATNGFFAFIQASTAKISTKWQLYTLAGSKYAAGVYGTLPTLADNDNITIPDIHARVVSHVETKSEPDMKPYTNTIPGTRVTFAMIPIPSGEFTMGSPAGEPDRQADEGPQHTVKISPFWMGKCEVTWNEYELFMYPDEEKRTRATMKTDEAGDKLADAVTHPSKPYVEMSFGMGKDGFPAIAMTQHAANKYCQWLSAKTGEFYRLPTEAEWEYACRAGTTTAYFFGDDAAKLPEYGWFEQNSDFKYQKVGKKKPNPWGLYDMCGNVVEWVLDQYDPDFYRACSQKGTALDPWNKATKPYPHSVRGGSWDDEAKKCRSAARRGSDRSWKMQDPQLPKSVWYFSDAQFVGFRIVRPLKVPPPEEMQKYWTSGVERD